MKPEIDIGCSSFNETNWKGVFYPEDLPRSRYFEYYCKHFGTYEMNGTFYKFPTVKSLKTWYDKAPEGFRFSVKAHRLITHYRKFLNCTEELAGFYATVRDGLADKLAFVLFQMPPSYHFSEERLALILGSLDYGFRNVIEFRHESWWKPEVFDAFAAKGVVFCSVSYPNLSEDVIAINNSVYVRLHGRPKLFFSGYSIPELEALHQQIKTTSAKEVFVYFNNTASAFGVLNAMSFKEIAMENPED